MSSVFFSDDTDLEKEDPEYEGKEDDYCSHCGWKYDLYQIEHPDVPNLTNELVKMIIKNGFNLELMKIQNMIIQKIIIQ